MAAKKKKSGSKNKSGGNKQQQQLEQQEPIMQDDNEPMKPYEVQQHKNLTHTNLDSTCFNTKGGWLARLEYQRSLLMALNPKEWDEMIVLILVVIFWTCFILYMHAFVSGFRDGFADPLSSAESILS